MIETPNKDERVAHLIAAAPDLLAALRDIIGQENCGSLRVTDGPGHRSARQAMRAARAAIAKAEGRS